MVDGDPILIILDTLMHDEFDKVAVSVSVPEPTVVNVTLLFTEVRFTTPLGIALQTTLEPAGAFTL